MSTYLTHRPALTTNSAISPLSTPSIRARSATTITPLDLDEGPDAPSWQQTEKSYEDDLDAQVRHLLRQARLWRVMNSALWVAWGIVQAKVPGMEEGIAEMAAASSAKKDDQHDAGNGATPKTPSVDADIDEEESFNYLAYAQDRALFFWSDLLALNLVNDHELPAPMVEHIKSRALEY